MSFMTFGCRSFSSRLLEPHKGSFNLSAISLQAHSTFQNNLRCHQVHVHTKITTTFPTKSGYSKSMRVLKFQP